MIYKTTNIYLEAADKALPGFVRGLYLVGSAALHAWQPGASDIDAIVYLSRPASEDDLAMLDRIHQGMPARPHFDAVYLDPELAAEIPMRRQVAPFAVDGVLRTGKPCGELTPVVWHILRTYGIKVRGTEIADLGIRVDPAELIRYNLENLRDYWQASIAGADDRLATLKPDEPVDGASVGWLVLGPARLHHTAATGGIISKSGAADYLGGLFPQYAGLARRVAAFRAGAPETFSLDDLRAAVESVDTVAEDAWRRFGHRYGSAPETEAG